MGNTANRYEDRADIIELMGVCTWALETRQFEDLERVFSDDAFVNIRGLECKGKVPIIFLLRAAVLRFERLQLLHGSHVVDVEGDTARHRCQMIVQQSAEGGGKGSNYLLGCHGKNRLVRTDDGWRFSEIVIVETWSEGTFDTTLG